MHLSSIQIEEEEGTKKFFPDHEVTYSYLLTCIAGEVGETANLVKKFERGDFEELYLIERLEEELPDILIYLVMLASHAGIDLEHVYRRKRAYNEHRFGNVTETQ